jgi:(2Fe-2S) ferredoxin
MDSKLHAGLEKAGLVHAKKHLFLCLGPDCCCRKDGEQLWEYVKSRVRDTGVRVMRTKADCFRICTDGPWLVVYPEGIWYSKVTPVRFERILQQHLLNGDPVHEWIVARNDLQVGISGGSGRKN